MLKLTEVNIQNISNNISNPMYRNNIKATKELINLFNLIIRTEISTWQQYVKIYDNNFYTYKNFKELVKSEEEEQSDGLTLDECIKELNKSIWKLPCGWYIQYV